MEAAEQMRTEPTPPPPRSEASRLDSCLRPKKLADFVGQAHLKKLLKMRLDAAKIGKRVLDHALFSGPPGRGKTSLAGIIATEMKAPIHRLHAPTLNQASDLIGVLQSVKQGDILFIDEIHRLTAKAEEILYPAMEEFILTIPPTVSKGDEDVANAMPIQKPLPEFTLVGATTRTGLLSAPLRDRFGQVYVLGDYTIDDLIKIVQSTAKVLKVRLDTTAARAIAIRSRQTPRVVINLVKQVRDYCDVNRIRQVNGRDIYPIMNYLGIDPSGLDHADLKYLSYVIDSCNGGPVGIDNICSAMGEEPDTLTETIEPFLMQQGYLIRTSKGRQVTEKAWKLLKKGLPDLQ